ncbi:MAG: WD40/YVTN/BNR-like repeat-containing protein [Candidatus Neomarinimicrobiota bacterium]
MNKIAIKLLFFSVMLAQSYAPKNFALSSVVQDTFISEGLLSNMVAEVRLMGDSLTWLGTGKGLALHDGHYIYNHHYTVDSLTDGEITNFVPYGGIPAIAVMNDTLAVAYSGDNGTIQVGHGITITYDANAVSDSSGISWKYLQQPMDLDSDTLMAFGPGFFQSLPVTVPEANVTYDVFLYGDYLWTASWAGGLRRYHLHENNWEVVPMPMDNQDSLSLCNDFDELEDPFPNMPYNAFLTGYSLNPRDPIDGGNHNHKAFSILVHRDTIWAGTANGINRGIIVNEWQNDATGSPQYINCIEWVHYTYQNSNLSGNFVVGLARQFWNGNTTIWAATMNADTPGEVRGLSYTRDGGLTWETALLGERIYNIATKDSLVLASSQSGLWKSFDGVNWAVFKPAIDTTFMSQSQILTDVVYASAIDERNDETTLWIGTSDGAALSSDLEGASWTIFQTEYDSSDFYAYPNPFSPWNHNQMGGDGYVRFHTGTIVNTDIELDIFNFGMEKVFQTNFNLNSYDGALKWNGRDMNGVYVHNGVYFIRFKYAPPNQSPQYFWDKLIVVK